MLKLVAAAAPPSLLHRCILSTVEKLMTCDLQNENQHLDCGDGLIVVHNVTASHRKSEACMDGIPPNQLAPPLCSMKPVLSIAAKKCNGRHRCVMSMDLCHMAAPFRTRCVWMDTTFTCENGRIHHVCQKNLARLYCGTLVIKVLRANYGRTSWRVCRYSAPYRQPGSTNCKQKNTLKKMATRCDGKHRCSVRASNLFFSNPCPGTHKYLEYSYTCVLSEADSE
ncbi:hypothetical protein LDENG_00150620 [Lucifuga dentata]|nr:hypothetical protein LDENG_00150620 [Lucifuga dentata]